MSGELGWIGLMEREDDVGYAEVIMSVRSVSSVRDSTGKLNLSIGSRNWNPSPPQHMLLTDDVAKFFPVD